MSRLLSMIALFPRRTAIGFISLYQATLSPDHGPLKPLFPYGCCIHSETCSMYGKRVIGEHGLLIGGFMTFKRVLTCAPWKKPDDERMLTASRK